MTDKQKKIAILVGLLILWGALILFRGEVTQGERSSRAPGLAYEGRRASRVMVNPGDTTLPSLKLDLLDSPLPPFRETSRNIFSSLNTSGPSPAIEAKTPTVPIPHPSPPPDPFLEETRKLRFLGFARAEGEVFAFLAGGNEIFIVKEHEVIKDRYMVKEINEDSILLSTPSGDKEVKLPLSPK